MKNIPMPRAPRAKESDQSIEVAVVRAQPLAFGDDIRDRAKVLWLTVCNQNARAVEWMLEQESRERSNGTGEAVEPWPAASTIWNWSRAGDWAGDLKRDLAENIGADGVSLKIKTDRQKHMAADSLTEVFLGVYDQNPAAGALRIKAAELTLKMSGRGTFGANAGGEEVLQITDLVEADDEYDDESDPMKVAAMNRERNQQEKRRHG
jgi:hypothetical protein